MIHVRLTMIALLWAGGFIAAKLITFSAGSFTISFLRFLLAAIILGALVYKQEKHTKIEGALLGYILGGAFLGPVCYNYLFFTGIKFIDASRASVIISTVPIAVVITSLIVFREKIGLMKVLGIILSVFGAWVVITRGEISTVFDQGIGRGEMYFAGCVLFATAFAFVLRKILKSLTPKMTMFCIASCGAAFSFIPAMIEIRALPIAFDSYSFLLGLLYFAIGLSVFAATIYQEGIKTIGPSRASQYMNLIPVFAVVLASIFLGEHVTGSLIIGGGLVTAGLYLANLS